MNGVEVTYTPASSNVASIAFDPATDTLTVEFNSGESYDYYNVPLSTYRAFQSAPSAGQFLNRHIKGRFAYELR